MLLLAVVGVSSALRSAKATVKLFEPASCVTVYLLLAISVPSILTLIEAGSRVRPADISSWNLYAYFVYLS